MSNLLTERGFNTIDVDHVQDLCAWVKKETSKKAFIPHPDNKFIDEHEYKCNMSILKNLMSEFNDHVLVFGSVGDNNDFIPLFDVLVLLQCKPETIMHRLQTRDTNVFGKVKEVQNRILEWRNKFDEIMLKAGAIPISTEEDIDAVAAKVTRLLE